MLLPSLSGAVQAWQSSLPPWVSRLTPHAALWKQDSRPQGKADEKGGVHPLDESATDAYSLHTRYTGCRFIAEQQATI